MDEVFANLMVILLTGILVGGIFFFVRRRQDVNEQKIKQMALEHGWQYESIREPLAWGVHLTGPDWSFEAISRSSGGEAGPGSSNVSMSTCWQAGVGGRNVLIGPRQGSSQLGSFAAQALQFLSKGQVGGLTEISVGSLAFRERYMLWADDPIGAQSLLSPAVESALLAWMWEPPIVKWTTQDLSIEIRGMHLRKKEQIEALIQIGEALLATTCR